MAEDVHFVHINYPQVKQVDKTTPMSCLETMGLLVPVEEGVPNDSECMALLNERGVAPLSAMMWQEIGGVDVTYLKDPMVFLKSGEIEGPCDVAEFERSPMVFCRAKCGKTMKTCMIMFAINRVNKIADLCAYDPKGDVTEENLYQMVGTAGSWLREMLGEGWGLRMEVYHDRYCPSEIPEMAKFWMFLMCLVKMYLPHVRMVDTQAALRIECFAKNILMNKIVSMALHRVYKVATSQV